MTLQVAGGRFGESLDVSPNGLILIVGAPKASSLGVDDHGLAQVFEYDATAQAYVKKGSAIVGESAADRLGQAVATSGDGRVVALGGHGSDGDGEHHDRRKLSHHDGHVLVYEFDEDANDYGLRGVPIEGSDMDNLGASVDLSDSGNVLAIGAWGSDADGLEDRGDVRVYVYDPVVSPRQE